MRVGFLGTGWIARYHSIMLKRVEGIERAGVYDPDIARAEQFAAASGHRRCASEDEVLDSCDAVYITTWTSEHPRLVAAAAARGLAIFCEKPLATSYAGAVAMAADVAAAGVIDQVGLVLRRSPVYLWAKHLVEAPEAGRVMTVVFRDDQFIPVQGHYMSSWRADQTKAGAGTLLEHSIHDIDMLHHLVGPITRVNAHDANFHGHPGIEDLMSASIRFENGATGTLTSVWHDNLARPSLRRIEIFCERRYIALDGDDWFGPVRWTDTDGSEHVLEGAALEQAGAALLAGDGAPAPGPINPDAEFIAAVRAGTAAWPSFATAVEAHAVAEAMYRSAAADGATIAVDEVRARPDRDGTGRP